MTEEEMLAELSDYFHDWIDGDYVVEDCAIDNGELVVNLDDDSIFVVSVMKL